MDGRALSSLSAQPRIEFDAKATSSSHLEVNPELGNELDHSLFAKSNFRFGSFFLKYSGSSNFIPDEIVSLNEVSPIDYTLELFL